MFDELSTRLEKTLEQIRLKAKLGRDLQAVESALEEQSDQLASLSAQLEKEKVDVAKLEGMSLAGLYHAVLGSREEQLEKERQELLAAQLAYQRARRQVDFLERERESLAHRLEGLAGIEAAYEQLLIEKERHLQQTDQPAAGELVGIAEQIANLNAEVKEISEAIAAGNQVISGLEQVIQSLESARSWGTWDLLGGDLLATAIKHSRIDDARKAILDVQGKLSLLTRELADVQNKVELRIDIESFDSFADFFLDGLIFDWIVQSKIIDSLDKSKKARDITVQAVEELEGMVEITQEKQRDLRSKRALIIQGS